MHHSREPALPGRGLREAEPPRSPHGGDVEAKDLEEEACCDVDYADGGAYDIYLAIARNLRCDRCQFTTADDVDDGRGYASAVQ